MDGRRQDSLKVSDQTIIRSGNRGGLTKLEKKYQFPISPPVNQFGFDIAGTAASFGTGNKTLAPLELAPFFAKMKGGATRPADSPRAACDGVLPSGLGHHFPCGFSGKRIAFLHNWPSARPGGTAWPRLAPQPRGPPTAP